MKRLFTFFIIPAFYGCVMAQDPVQVRYAGEINPENAKAHLSILASAEFEGRGTGEPGGERAAAYIAEEFRRLGLAAPVDGSHFQPVKLIRTRQEVRAFSIAGQSFTHGKDFYLVGSGPQTKINAKD